MSIIHKENIDLVLGEEQEFLGRTGGIVNTVPGAFVVGSYLSNPDTANDIDVVVPYCVMYGSTIYLRDFIITNRDDPEYDRSDLSCLVETRRGGKDNQINILVINDPYLAAYYAAVADQTRNPENYATRDQRVENYYFYEKRVKDMLEGRLG